MNKMLVRLLLRIVVSFMIGSLIVGGWFLVMMVASLVKDMWGLNGLMVMILVIASVGMGWVLTYGMFDDL